MITTAMPDLMIREAGELERERWDELVRRFPNHRITHLSAWIDSLVDAGCGRALYLVFERGGEIVGCLPGLIATLGGLRFFGSPLEGWQTVSMGPAFDPARLDVADIMAALVPWLEREQRVVHTELMLPGLDGDAMRAAGFEGQSVPTFRASLNPANPEQTFKAMKDSARRNVRRAQKLGLEVKVETDERFVDTHYAQLVEVYLRGGHLIPFGKQRILSCFRQMKAAGRLLALGVYLPGGRINIATGMFFIEGTELYLWMWAHPSHYRWYRPTELMTWTAMQKAMEAGCTTFDFMGRGDFKSKFGAEPDDTKMRWLRSRPRWLMQARRVAGSGFRIQQTIRGRWGRAAARSRAAETDSAVPACVMGDIDLVRALGLAGIPSMVVAPPGSAARFSMTAAGALDWVDPWERSEELVESLIAHGQAQSEPPVLFYQDDRGLLLVSRLRDRLRGAFRFVIPDATLVEQLVDKHRFQQLATRLALPVPPARAYRTAHESFSDDGSLTFPVIVKPLTRRNDQWNPLAAGKAMSFANADELRAFWPKLSAARAEVMVQSQIEGPESAIESYHVYVDEKGVTAGEFTGKKVRTWPTAYGDTTALEITGALDVETLGRDVVKRLKLRGVAKLDFKRGPDGKLYLLEVNPRFTLWNHAGAEAGVNLPALVFADCTGGRRPAAVRARAGVRWCKVWSDCPAARSSGVPLLQWLPWALRCETKSAFAWDDPMPLVGAAVWRILGRRRPTSSPDTSARLIPPVTAADGTARPLSAIQEVVP
ncbi:MAG TPA: GNAT family N-acetyltransferase [Gemmatimonadales bacterium]